MSRKTTLRTTIEPGKVITVDERELVDLERQDLIHSRELADGEAPRKGEKSWRPEVEPEEADDDETVPEPATTPGVITDAPAKRKGASA